MIDININRNVCLKFSFLIIFFCEQAFASCVVQEFEGDYFYLKNDCSQPINIKYTYSDSRKFSGGYSTLQPTARTFDKAKRNETYKYYFCDFPSIPQSITGGCVKP